MKKTLAGLIAAVVWVAGCTGKPPVAAVPAAPTAQPRPVATDPVSVPQTVVRLPPDQPVPPDAVPPEPKPTPRPDTPPPAAAPPAPEPTTKAAPRPRAATPPPVENSQPGVAAPPRTTAPSPPLRPLLTPEQEQELNRRIDQSVNAAEKVIGKLSGRALSPPQQAVLERVSAFLDQARQARKQGDLAPARSLAERAETLAADLARSFP